MASTALGPASTPPPIMRVKWTPRNGKRRIGNGIDQVLDQVLACLGKVIVFAAEGDDLHARIDAALMSDAVAVQSAAIDQSLCVHLAGVGLERDAVGADVDGDDAGIGADFSAAFADHTGVGAGDMAVIDDAGFGNVKPGDAANVRLVAGQVFAGEAFDAFKPLALPRRSSSSRAGSSSGRVATTILPHLSCSTLCCWQKSIERRRALDAELGLERSRACSRARNE